MPYLAGNKITMQTDTGGGVADKANNKNVQFTNPYKSTQTTSKSPTSTTASTAKKSVTPSTATASTATQNTQTNKKKYYNNYSNRSYSGYSGYSGGNYSSTNNQQEDQAKKNSNANYNALLKLLNQTATNETSALTNNANNYAAAAAQNLANAESIYNNVFNSNTAALNNLSAQNVQREALINQSISDYYNKMANENASREQATLAAIDEAYKNLMGNANDYYGSVMDAYDRASGIVNQGYEEGNQVSAAARDEAIALAEQLYAMGESTQNRETEKALRGQYASYMKGMRNLNQRLAAQGINGGATETSMLNALNGYEANRTDLNEAKLSALGALRQQQMQSDSEAQQAYLAKVADLISQRTSNQLGVENTRSTGELNYANMKNSAETNKSNQSIEAQNNFQNWKSTLENNYANMNQTAQNNFQNWAANLANQWTSNNNNYATNMGNLANSKNDVAYNNAGLSNAAAQAAGNIYTNQAYIDAVTGVSNNGGKAKVKSTKKSDNKSSKSSKSKSSSSSSSSSKKSDSKSSSSKKSTKKTTKK